MAGSSSAAAAARQKCEARYRTLLDQALETAIHDEWLTGEAAKDGVHVTQDEVEQEFELSRKSVGTEAQFEAYLKRSGQTTADVLYEIKLGKLTDGLFAEIKAKDRPVSSADVARYYREHLREFSTPPGRSLRIFRTTTEPSALKAKQEIEAGKSFAKVVNSLSAVGQPIETKEGYVADLLPNVYEEKALNDAIFAARPHRLYGPLKVTALHKTIAPETNSGYFVFEVIGVAPGRTTPLAQIRTALSQRLAKQRNEDTIAGFVRAFRRRWTARTSCQPGYVVKGCKQFRPTKDTPKEDPFTL